MKDKDSFWANKKEWEEYGAGTYLEKKNSPLVLLSFSYTFAITQTIACASSLVLLKNKLIP